MNAYPGAWDHYLPTEEQLDDYRRYGAAGFCLCRMSSGGVMEVGYYEYTPSGSRWIRTGTATCNLCDGTQISPRASSARREIDEAIAARAQ